MASAVSPEHRFARHGIVRLDLARHHLPIVRRKKTPYGWNRACRLRNASRNQVDDLFFFLFETLLFFLSPAVHPFRSTSVRRSLSNLLSFWPAKVKKKKKSASERKRESHLEWTRSAARSVVMINSCFVLTFSPCCSFSSSSSFSFPFIPKLSFPSSSSPSKTAADTAAPAVTQPPPSYIYRTFTHTHTWACLVRRIGSLLRLLDISSTHVVAQRVFYRNWIEERKRKKRKRKDCVCMSEGEQQRLRAPSITQRFFPPFSWFLNINVIITVIIILFL